MPNFLDGFASARLAALEGAGVLRVADDGARRRAVAEAAARHGLPPIDASSNDYLGLAATSVSRETDVQGALVGAGASRLIHGTRDDQVALERLLATWVGTESSLLFTSGYAANLGLLGALGEPGTVVLSDELNHASTIDGCRLARAAVEIIPHLDLAALEQALVRHTSATARWVVTESCFSMDGDGPDLGALRTLCDRYQAGLIVDEAHALGVFGPRGAGRCAEAGVVPDALVGTLGKSVGSQGAFVAGSSLLRTLLWNRARSFVFSTATSPLLARLTALHVERLQAGDDLRARLRHSTRALREALTARGLTPLGGLEGPIVPLVVGENRRAVELAGALESLGILAQAIRPPTVPEGSARVRLTVSAAWPDGAAARIADAIAEAMQSHG